MLFRVFDGAIVFHSGFQDLLWFFCVFRSHLSTSDNFCFPLLVCSFRFFEDIYKVLSSTDCLARLVDDGNRLDEGRHVGEGG